MTKTWLKDNYNDEGKKMKEIPCRVQVDTDDYYRDLKEVLDNSTLRSLDSIIRYANQISDLTENYELELYEDELLELKDNLRMVKEYIENSIKE